MNVLEENPYILQMDIASFQRISAYISKEYGIKLPESKKPMLQGRLNKKIRSLGMTSYKEFIDYIFSEEGRKRELYNVVDLITTNKTDFYRESAHFHFLTNEFLPRYQSKRGRSPLKIWSSACSTGEEPYTIIMEMEEYKKRHPDFSYSLLASDISIRALQAAYQGIYEQSKISSIPLDIRRTYFLQSKTDPHVFRIKPFYRKKIIYKRINLMEDSFGLLKADYDIIFCRNVLIYFNKLTQEEVIGKLCQHLRPGGLLFLGHSESILGMQLPLKQIKPTLFQKI
ncbi:CheR family methyltransferase [Cytophagaceae bacterium DM2B3-1]|uniref:protein-glutamate O-methyltransferase n=1 Tax=Xanthocytophaga flava TaxID=3048013 RepID=A0ABT7CEL2_9BACT|nr:CheR family methyltransferase [Xanthocytophaga flavus]MDJ1469004.1 CheR family methyltransferase [Xanthocytophaga flavus]MDJ1492182.1 CheR family methyltransferase [Xanthocytophaga flavus]